MLRYKIGILFFLMLCMCSISFISAKDSDFILLGKIIYIDPGHGGLDPGAIYKDIEEKKLNLEISEKLKKKLESLGAIVYLTRYGDYDLAVPNAINRKRSDLSRRGNIINKSMCDLYISIHLNAEISSTWNGAQVFYDDINKDNVEIAKIMQEHLKQDLKTNREYKETSTMYLHKRITRPGVLIEVGFLTNPNERYLLRQESYQLKVINSITNGAIDYLTN